MGSEATIQKCFYDELTELQGTLLRLLGMSPTAYFSAGAPGSGPRI